MARKHLHPIRVHGIRTVLLRPWQWPCRVARLLGAQRGERPTHQVFLSHHLPWPRRVARLLGSGHGDQAMLSASVAVRVGTAVTCALGLALYALRDELGWAFTSDDVAVVKMLAKIAPEVAIYQVRREWLLGWSSEGVHWWDAGQNRARGGHLPGAEGAGECARWVVGVRAAAT